jgi:parvulin-like peptidyl-prolyl isomerase
MRKKRHSQPAIHIPSRHEQSRVQKEARIRRIIIIASAAFLTIVTAVIAIGLYIDNVRPMNQVILQVNSRSFKLGYYVDYLKSYSQAVDPGQMSTVADALMSQITRDEVIRQGARNDGIVIALEDVKKEMESQGLTDSEAHRDAATAALSFAALRERFLEVVPAEMEQVRFEVMLVESRSVADEVKRSVGAGTPLTELVEQYSSNPNIPVEQDWVPLELLANADVSRACATLDPGQITSIPDEQAAKYGGYWLIEVIDKDDSGAIKPRAMLIGSLEEALAAKSRLDSEDFATVAADVSQFMGADENAELGWVGLDDTVTETFDDVAFSLELNTVSDPVFDKEVQTLGGYWVVNLLGRELHEVSSGVAQGVASLAFNDWYTAYRDAASVEEYLTTEQKNWAIERAVA